MHAYMNIKQCIDHFFLMENTVLLLVLQLYNAGRYTHTGTERFAA